MHSLPPTRLPHYNHVDHAIATFHMLLISNAPLVARVLSTPVESNFHPPTPSTATATNPPTTMAPATKRRKTATQRYACHTCLEDRTTGQFPNYNPTETCDHLINTCKSCLKEWIQSQIETTVFKPHIQCPQCDQKMNSRDIRMAVSKTLFARYVVASLILLDRSFNADDILQVRRARAQLHCRKHSRLALVSCSRLPVRSGPCESPQCWPATTGSGPGFPRKSDQDPGEQRRQGYFADRLDQQKRRRHNRSDGSPCACSAVYINLQRLWR
jgi:hypothetical protein